MFVYIVYIPILIILLALSFFVFLKNRRSKINVSFSLLNLAISIWVFTLIFADTIKDYQSAFLWNQLALIGPALIPFFFLLFVIFYLKEIKLKKINVFLLAIPVLLIFLFIPSPFNIEKIVIHDWGAEVIPGNLYFFVLFYYVFYMGVAFLLLGKQYKNSRGIKRVQTKYIFLGALFSTILGLVTNLILLFFGISNLSILAPFAGLIMSVFIAYAILRYRLMDIRVIVRRSAVFGVLVLMITSVYALFAYLISVFFQGLIGTQSIVLNGVITAVFVAIGFEPLKIWLSRATDKYLFKAEYHPQEVIAEFSDKLTTSLDLNKITRFLVRKLDKVFKASFVSIFLLNEDKKQYLRAAGHGQPAKRNAKIDKKLFSEIFNYLKNSGQEREIIVLDEVIKINEQIKNPALDLLIKNFTEHGVNLAVPMYLRDKLVSILFLGDKKSGDVYSQEDLRVLEIIAAHSAVAIQNSKLYQEQKNFAIYLEKVVKERTLELKAANIQLKKLDKAKSEFISIASHQLRTPLTVIKGYISMINQGDFGKIPNPVVNPLDRVYKSTIRIITLVEDLLNISRIESGRMKYEFAEINLEKIVKSVFEELEQHAKNKGLKFIYQPAKTKLPKIILDQKKTREVVMNLMDNAIKYTDKGNIVVSLEKQKDKILYCVEDTGRGLEPDEIPMLFQKFSRARGATLVHTEGTGLGLYIAKQMVQKHGGKIWVESDGSNKGSRFCVQFKIKNPQLEKDMKKQPKSKK